jgi:hypothetical protein
MQRNCFAYTPVVLCIVFHFLMMTLWRGRNMWHPILSNKGLDMIDSKNMYCLVKPTASRDDFYQAWHNSNLFTRGGWSSPPHSLLTPERAPVPIGGGLVGSGWPAASFREEKKSLCPQRDRIPDRPARSESLCRPFDLCHVLLAWPNRDRLKKRSMWQA